MDKDMDGVLLDDEMQLSFLEICHDHGVSEETLLDLLAHGLLNDVTLVHRNVTFQGSHLKRILSACRLQHDLELNVQGVILALELMDELEALQQQLQILQRHVGS